LCTVPPRSRRHSPSRPVLSRLIDAGR
jgi:hypothetical protein